MLTVGSHADGRFSGILDIALVEVSGYWILDISSLRILVIATPKTEQHSASGAKSLNLLSYSEESNHNPKSLMEPDLVT